ncbi:MAG: alkaline phosphatase family protein [Candidatus Hodarchaeota archaeon]
MNYELWDALGMLGSKLIIIGIDGATFKIIKPLVNKNELPTFKKLMNGGSWGELESTIPAVTCPAWPSFVTGKNPLNHGVYDWFSYNKDYSTFFFNSTSIRGKRYWDYLNEVGLLCGVINMPVSYPPQKIAGFMISGFLSSKDKDFTFPKYLKEELLRNGYILERRPDSISDIKFFKDMLKIFELRKRTTIRLMKSEEWDVLTVVFRPEPAQHRFWKKGKIRYLYQIYKAVDRILDEILKEAGEETNIILMSDHGFGTIPKFNVYFNTWLVNEGYQTVYKRPIFSIQKLHIFLHKFGLENIKKSLKKKAVSAVDITSGRVIWHKTKAWARISEDTGFIFINRKGRFKHGIVGARSYTKITEELIKKLENLRNPKNNEKVIEKIWKKEELYNGYEIAPDIIFKIKPQYKGRQFLEKDVFIEIPNYARIGQHSPKGIFIAFGPNIKKKKLETAKIIDLAPTILALYGLKSEDMDGQVLDVIKKEIKFKKKPKVSIRQDLEMHEADVFDEKDKEKIMERLRALGYIE